ncbi:MAG TPA: hypothetical protein VN281_15320 [Verrucomicrobiae bacterium]|jgi:hypothetical protein|nr:hypothetical protein [Verrucomicrobiae bacterium]
MNNLKKEIRNPGGRVSIAATRDEAGQADGFWPLALAARASEKARVPFEWSPVPAPEHMKLSSRLFMDESWDDCMRDDRCGLLEC